MHIGNKHVGVSCLLSHTGFPAEGDLQPAVNSGTFNHHFTVFIDLCCQRGYGIMQQRMYSCSCSFSNCFLSFSRHQREFTILSVIKLQDMLFLISLREQEVLYEINLWHRKIIIISYDEKVFYSRMCKAAYIDSLRTFQYIVVLYVINIVSGFPEVLEIL